MGVDIRQIPIEEEYGVISAVILGVISAALVIYFWFSKASSANPFTEEHVRTPGPVETNRKKRDQIIKQGFTFDKVPKNLDAIVVGSGLGGLSCAGCLARAGKKVLVLEQHDRAGGCTHTYEEKGFEFDIGLHYIGQVHKGSLCQTMLDVLSDGQLVWETLDKEFDTVVIGNDDGKQKFFNYVSGKGDFEKRLIELFPEEEKAILEFMKMVKKCSKSILGFIMLKMLPKWLLRLLIATKLYKLWSFGFAEFSKETVTEVLDRLTNNKDLKIVLSYSFGDYGTLPSKTPFFMQAVLMYHFYHASYYPRGGASELAYSLIPGILRSGGAVLVRAPVSQIIFRGNKAVGVSVSKGGRDHEIYAPIIISNAGAINTYNKLIPNDVSNRLGLKPLHRKVSHGMSGFQVLVGLRGNKEELCLPNRNYWIYASDEPERDMTKYLSLSREDAANERVPLLFVSFPSTKDSSWPMRYPGKSVCVIVTFSNWDWFCEWDKDRVMKRGLVYDDLKKTFQDQIWSQVLELFPQFKDKVEYIDTGTPVTHSHYIASPRGEYYGVDHSMERFTYDVSMDMRPKTKVPGLYLTGQDVLTAGIVASSMGGMLTASEVLGRHLIKDIYALISQRKKRAQRKQD